MNSVFLFYSSTFNLKGTNVLLFFIVLMSTTISPIFVKIGSKTKKNITRTFFVNKQLKLSFNFLKTGHLNFAQNFRKCLFDLANSESGKKSTRFEIFLYWSVVFLQNTYLDLVSYPFKIQKC